MGHYKHHPVGKLKVGDIVWVMGKTKPIRCKVIEVECYGRRYRFRTNNHEWTTYWLDPMVGGHGLTAQEFHRTRAACYNHTLIPGLHRIMWREMIESINWE